MLKFRKLKEKIFLIATMLLTFLAAFPLVHIIYSVIKKGIGALGENFFNFLTATFSQGGIGPAIVGSFYIIALSTLFGVPIALLSGIYMHEYPKSSIGRTVRKLLHLMLEFPTILVGVFVMGIIVVPMGTYSVIAGAVALAIVMIPYIATYTCEALNSIPFTYKEAGFSLGLTRTKVIFKILLPMARRGVITGILIGIAKAAGETAPLLFTIGGLYETFPKNITGPVGAVPLLIYNLVQSPSENAHQMAWGASLVLLLIFLGIFIPVRLMVKEVKL